MPLSIVDIQNLREEIARLTEGAKALQNHKNSSSRALKEQLSARLKEIIAELHSLRNGGH